MKTTTPEISWHARDPVYSVDFQFIKGDIQRLATCGTDRNVRIWEVKVDDNGTTKVEFLSSLQRHTRTVNVVRFSPCDSAIMIWRLNEASSAPNIFGDDEAEEQRETWSVVRALRSHLEDVYDLSWGIDGNTLMSGSVDNSAIFWDVKKGVRIAMFPDHKSFVQGVAVDPRGLYLATLSADRHCRIYSTESKNCLHTVSKVNLPHSDGDHTEPQYQTCKMFHDDTMKSFFRRLTFSPDGQLLIVPAGCVEKQDQTTANVSYVFCRTDLTKPVLQLPGPKTATLAVRCCPILFTLRPVPRSTPLPPKTDNTQSKDGDKAGEKSTLEEWEKYETLFCLPYRMVFAVACEDSVLLYDTQQTLPIAYVSNIHYHTLSDISWSPNGRNLAVASTDGFITFITFSEGELGEEYSEQVLQLASRADITRTEQERREQRQRKKKEKEEARKALAAKTTTTENQVTDSKKDCSEAKNSASKQKQQLPEMMETEASEAPLPTTPSSSTTGKTPRRIQVTSLPPSSPPAVLKNCENTASANHKLDNLNSPKTPRRVGITTLKTYSSPTGRSSVGSSSPSSSASPSVTAKKRVQLTTLSTFQEKGVCGTESSPAESDLHLVLETTCDGEESPTSSLTPSRAPRRVNITTLP